MRSRIVRAIVKRAAVARVTELVVKVQPALANPAPIDVDLEKAARSFLAFPESIEHSHYAPTPSRLTTLGALRAGETPACLGC